MNKTRSKYYLLALLALMFAAPGISAYFFYKHPSWLGTSLVNKGTFINPPMVIKLDEASNKWRIVFWSPESCEESCLQHLDTLARVRLALGRKLYDVDQWLVLGNQAQPVSETLRTLLKEQDFHVVTLSADETDALKKLSAGTRVFLANPENYLILSYQSEVNPNDVYKDLKLLLNTTQYKNG